MSSKEKEYQYEVRVNGVKFMTGDTHSIAVVFNNLSGINFEQKPDPVGQHSLWLKFMEKTFNTALPMLAEIKMVSPENVLLECGCIGEGLPRPDPEVGQSYMVKTTPPGAQPIWHLGKLNAHNAETPTTRELFHFDIGAFVLPVTRAEVKERVMPVPPKGKGKH